MTRQQNRKLLREAQAIDGGITLSYISPGETAHAFTDSMLSTALADSKRRGRVFGKFGGYISMQSGPRIVEARNQVIELFLTDEAFDYSNWLVMIDADMAWSGDDLLDMVERAEAHERPIVGGLCFAGGRSTAMYPTCYVVEGLRDDGLPKCEPQDLSHPDMVAAISSDTPPSIQCDATGAAFMAVHKKVLIGMHEAFSKNSEGKRNPHPWFAEMVGDGVQYGEDITFCLRARQLGYPIWLDTAVKVGHVKSHMLDWDGYVAKITAQREATLAKSELILP